MDTEKVLTSLMKQINEVTYRLAALESKVGSIERMQDQILKLLIEDKS